MGISKARGVVIVQAVRDAFYFLHHDPFEGKHRRVCYVDAFNRNWSIAERELIMAKKEATGKTALASSYQEIKFVNRNLTDEEKAHHDEQNYQIGYLAVEFVKLATGGYTVKLSFDAYSKCMQATLIVWNSANPNYGYGLSARGATGERAISLLLYKHYEVLHENWAAFYKATSSSMEG